MHLHAACTREKGRFKDTKENETNHVWSHKLPQQAMVCASIAAARQTYFPCFNDTSWQILQKTADVTNASHSGAERNDRISFAKANIDNYLRSATLLDCTPRLTLKLNS